MNTDFSGDSSSIRFCSKCGKRMDIVRSKDEYDTLTGKKTTYYVWRCPDKRWFNLHDVLTNEYHESVMA